jgi:anti-anti-sigma regulatory factor
MVSTRKAQRENGKTQVRFEPVLDVAHARALHAQLGQAMGKAVPVVLDVSQVVRVDTAAMQVLTAFQQAARDRGIPLQWSGTSHALEEADRLLGLRLLGGEK